MDSSMFGFSKLLKILLVAVTLLVGFAQQSYANFDDVNFAKFDSEKSIKSFLKNNPQAERVHPKLMWVEVPSDVLSFSALSFASDSLGLVNLQDNKKNYKIEEPTPNVAASFELSLDKELVPSDLHEELWGTRLVNATEAWKTTMGSRDVIVATLDSGLDKEHSILKRNVWYNEKELHGERKKDDDNNGYKDDIWGIDLVRKRSKKGPTDDKGHGSHVAGIIAGYSEAEKFYGIAPNVRIMAIKTHNREGNGSRKGVTKGMLYAVDNGAKVINCSWGGAPEAEEYDEMLYDAINYADENGVMVVASAGNKDVDNDEIDHYPSNYDNQNMIAVAAIDKDIEYAIFSNFGKKTVHIAAPGTNILSAMANVGWLTDKSGTSMAAPHVSAAVALIRSTKKGEALSNKEIRDILMNKAMKLDDLSKETQSNGLLDLSFLNDGTWN